MLSKATERVLNTPSGAFMEEVDAFGDSQFAFRKRRGCADLVFLLMCSWLRDFQLRRKIGIFLSDISGAFDRVDTEKLFKKLRRTGVCEPLLVLVADYLGPRRAQVGVDGELSFEFTLQNMIFQGTVWGPSLWNVFFSDVHAPAEHTGGRERRFADDLSVSKSFERSVANEEILADLQECQASVLAWGDLNRVKFDLT